MSARDNYSKVIRLLNGKLIPFSRKLRACYIEPIDRARQLIVVGCYNRFLTFYVCDAKTSLTIVTTYEDSTVRLRITSHFIKRFKERYNTSDNWKMFLVKELSTLVPISNNHQQAIRSRTRHGYAVVKSDQKGTTKTILCITYIPKFKRLKKINPPMNVFKKLNLPPSNG